MGFSFEMLAKSTEFPYDFSDIEKSRAFTKRPGIIVGPQIHKKKGKQNDSVIAQ